MKFIDTAEIKVKAGDGGLGMSHFRREKFVPFGGPDGGDGGKGGDVFVEANEGMSTLLDFRYQRYHEGFDGGKGGTNNRVGKTGAPLVLKVPCGTVISDPDTNEIIGEVLTDGSRVCVALGGKGGVGNTHFASSKNQAPTRTLQPGLGERKSLVFELKMLADVGIIGSPNAGKSTLVTVISAARPKVADYPFTTLVPNLGVVSHKNSEPFVVADVPGLIVGASEGKGFGHDFLRHIERTRVLVHLVDVSQGDTEIITKDYEGILNELEIFNARLMAMPRITVLSKLDVVANTKEENPLIEKSYNEFREYLKSKKIDYLEISAANREGIDKLLDKLIYLLSELPKTAAIASQGDYSI